MDNESVDLIIYDDILEKDLLEECFRILKQDGTLWLITNKNNIVDEMKLIREVGFINNFENWWTINIKDYTTYKQEAELWDRPQAIMDQIVSICNANNIKIIFITLPVNR